jgi:hypothetical protein
MALSITALETVLQGGNPNTYPFANSAKHAARAQSNAATIDTREQLRSGIIEFICASTEPWWLGGAKIAT